MTTFSRYFSRYKSRWIFAALLVIAIRLFSSHAGWVEDGYTNGFYRFFSRLLRCAFGWLPFSIGDVIYFVAGLWVLIKIIKHIKLLFSGQLFKKELLFSIFNLIFISCCIYIIFNLFWGINYDRKGIAYELRLDSLQYDTADLLMLQSTLVQKLNFSKKSIATQEVPVKKELFRRAQRCYEEAAVTFPFLLYEQRSVKSSFYGWMGNYLGFTGYYNPFTGEAQVNTTIPAFMQPFVAVHEIGHQIGYAKEDEANFSGYLAAAYSSDTVFRYAAYFDLFLYANREVYFFDSAASRTALDQLDEGVKKDMETLIEFSRTHRSPLEPVISWLYGNYLKMNRQPQGIRSYNEVIAMLIAYYKKYGKL